VLIRRASQELKVPFLASGGMADGYTLAAAISLGACGMNCGTRFMATVEAPIHMKIKKKIVEADENSTILVMRRWKNTARLYKNSVSEQVAKIEKESTKGDFAEVYPLMSGARGRKVYETGDPEYGIWWAGVSAGLVGFKIFFPFLFLFFIWLSL
jgi:NAD(P)H-dependent flavin oxidoreductase YrpB (nitropropane dioxygenase family)